ncbi:MAG: sugar ABC transporter permease [Acidobacteria bacterium]|jgi:D-xylose transport system permease protein|nr:MAG: sugar ABC transporter permease [Acidobacteriota bacterium]GIU82516.1 MAG: D-xylose ABC transporter permease [Pyrinomonadaceae bacterium]
MKEEKQRELQIKLQTSSLRAYTMLAILILIWLFFHWQTGGIFLTPRNLSNLMLQTSVTGILAIGMLMLIAAGQIDLSVGSVLGLAGGVAAIAITYWDYGVAGSIILAIFVCMLIGFVHGTLVAYFNIPAFIVTLGGLLAWRGAIKGLSQGETVPILNPTFKAIGQSNVPANVGWTLALVAIALILFLTYNHAKKLKKLSLETTNNSNNQKLLSVFRAIILSVAFLLFTYVMNLEGGIPFPVLIFLLSALAGTFITNSTVFGRHLYAIGGNREAARLSGIDTKGSIVKVYILLGMLTGVAAVIFAARQASASPDAGTLKELEAIAACVIGGASLVGGRGTIFGACLGALIMSSLDNGMSLLNIRDYVQEIIKGTILVLAVGIDMAGRKTRG